MRFKCFNDYFIIYILNFIFFNIGYLNYFLLRINFLKSVDIITTQSIKNGVYLFYVGFTWDIAITQVYDIKDIEASKLGGSIECNLVISWFLRFLFIFLMINTLGFYIYPFE